MLSPLMGLMILMSITGWVKVPSGARFKLEFDLRGAHARFHRFAIQSRLAELLGDGEPEQRDGGPLERVPVAQDLECLARGVGYREQILHRASLSRR